MAVKTLLEQIEEVQAAITEVMTSQEQEYGSAGRLRRARLSELHTREKDLLARYQVEQGTGGPAINVGVHRRDY